MSNTTATTAPNINPALTDRRPLSALREDPKNARRHPARNLRAIEASLRDLGQQKPIVIDAKGVIIAGNGTYRAARALGWSELAVVVFKGSAQDARAFAIADNRTAELAEWDAVGLQGTMADLGEVRWEALAFTPDELRCFASTLPSASLPAPDAGEPAPVDARPLAHAEQDHGADPDDKLGTFMAAQLRQIVLIYKAEEYGRVVAALEQIQQDQGLDSNTAAVDWLIAQYQAVRGGGAGGSSGGSSGGAA